MKKIIAAALAFACVGTASADTLPQFKEKTAKALIRCLNNPPRDGGNSYTNVCYGEAAEKIGKYAEDLATKVYSRKSAADGDKNGVLKDKAFFKKSLADCDSLPGASLPDSWHTGLIHTCRIRRGLAYADYFNDVLQSSAPPETADEPIEKTVRELFGI